MSRTGLALFICACAWMALVSSAAALPPSILSTSVTSVTTDAATLQAQINPQGKLTRYHFEYGTANCASAACTSVPIPEAEIPVGSSPVAVQQPIAGLIPGTVYHFRVVAKNGETTQGSDRVFATLTSPLGGLPDGRAYEQSSPTDKDGGDAVGKVAFVKAIEGGGGITFGSAFGIPGGKGSQALPLYLAQRGGSAGWLTEGLLPPASYGERAQILGWLPDFSATFSTVTQLTSPRVKAFLAQPTNGAEPIMIAPYTPEAEYTYAGASSDGSVVLFVSQAKLPPKEGGTPIPAALQGQRNLYAWDEASGELSLAGVLNDGTVPPGGVLPGAGYESYLEDMNAVSDEGSIFFTAVSDDQLYERVNPTQPQSAISGGQCTEPAKACTFHLSASQKTNGDGPGGTDAAGPQKANFQAASADGSVSFFTSSEKLTNNANTGPEQPLAAIGRSNIDGTDVEPIFIPSHAVGVAVDATYVYWADPGAGTIGRAKLDGTEVNDAFIEPGPVEFEVEVKIGKEEFETQIVSEPSQPRYLAVDAGHVYWTNTGRIDEGGPLVEGGGTIGRANLDGSEVEADFIRGATNPQGIAVNATHIYWANARPAITIGRAAIDGSAVEESFFKVIGNDVPFGVALSGSDVCFGSNEEGNKNAFVTCLPLGGGAEKLLFVGKGAVRGVAIDATHIYWANPETETIGVANLALAIEDSELVKVEGKLNGVAVDAAHLYWSTNGEAPTNPGNDLYRYVPGATEPLSDLTSDSTDENGAEVEGVLGASKDGSRVYFAANADLDGAGPAAAGDCKGKAGESSGQCSVYLWDEGATSFVAPVNADGGEADTDSLAWTRNPNGLGAGAYFPKTSFLSTDGATLLFRSQEKLTDYDNEGVPMLYRFVVGEAEIDCVSCSPGGEAPKGGPSLGSIEFPGLAPLRSTSVSSRNLSTDGKRAFFETNEALSPNDTNGQGGCPGSGAPAQEQRACTDVYEWEAPGSGSCSQASPSYSPLNGGCIYLISTGKDTFPSLFADASASGDDVFFFTRQRLVGQDEDELQDVYDARVGGGLASQNPPPPPLPCEGSEGCQGPVPPQPPASTPGSASFVGPGNQVSKHKKQKAKKHKAKKHNKAKQKKHKKKARRRGNQ
jgi:virginiamycin B lyase